MQVYMTRRSEMGLKVPLQKAHTGWKHIFFRSFNSGGVRANLININFLCSFDKVNRGENNPYSFWICSIFYDVLSCFTYILLLLPTFSLKIIFLRGPKWKGLVSFSGQSYNLWSEGHSMNNKEPLLLSQFTFCRIFVNFPFPTILNLF